MWLYMPKQRTKPIWSTVRTKPIRYPILHDFAVVKVLGTQTAECTNEINYTIFYTCFILSKFGWFSNVFHPHFFLFLHHWPPPSQRRDPRQDQTIEVRATRTRWAPATNRRIVHRKERRVQRHWNGDFMRISPFELPKFGVSSAKWRLSTTKNIGN